MADKRSTNAGSVEGLQKALEALTAQMAALNSRLEKLETAGTSEPAVASAPGVETAPVAAPAEAAPVVAAEAAPEAVKSEDEFNEELLLVLSAAVSAFLGKRPHIRAIRLQGSGAWAQQGRVFVQASHQLNVPHEA